MNSKKCISPVVAIALLLVVAVVAVIGFQNWFGSFSSEVYTDVEQKGDTATSGSVLDIETVSGETLYVKNQDSSNISLKEVKINGVICLDAIVNVSKGVEGINISDCIEDMVGKIDVVIITEDQIIEKKIYVDKPQSSQTSLFVEPGNQSYNSYGTYYFNVPENVTSITIHAVGAGGGGGYSNFGCCIPYATGGGGGGGGEYSSTTISVSPSEVLKVIVGEGGFPGMNTITFAKNGTNSSVLRNSSGTILVLANGGRGGKHSDNFDIGGVGGSGGSGGINSISAGQNGLDGKAAVEDGNLNIAQGGPGGNSTYPVNISIGKGGIGGNSQWGSLGYSTNSGNLGSDGYVLLEWG
ncbi:MAG: glycine-rich domain-containing protein [Nanoarchaeota archaeon]